MTGPGKAIHTVLVANRGEIAGRVIDAARDLGLRTVAVYAEPDRGSPHVALADVAVALGGTTAAETYLDQGKLLDAALAQGADAIHPGYGFLAENATFARAVVETGLTWIGPHPEAIATMGDKLAAKDLAARVGLPTLPSAAIVGDDERSWRQAAGAVGYPLLVKAAAGGGGRGMRLVADETELADAVRTARREAEAAFGDGRVFAERWLAGPRHIEIQIVGDKLGNVIHLGERECSIQRRHQKLIEEAPSPAVDEVLREQMGAAAVELARAIGYDSVGTVELLLDPDRREFFFLEMNTRIQVEHRVTEEVAGCDLVWWQFQCAHGDPLDWTQDDLEIESHAVEVRLYAEDPVRDWAPSVGRILHFRDDTDDDLIRVDDTILLDGEVAPGWEVTPHFDALLAKVVAPGPTRDIAIGRLVRYLSTLELDGLVTNRDYLLAVLQHPDFVEGRTTTLFVADHPLLLEAGPTPDVVAEHALAADLWAEAVAVRPWGFAPAGWRNVGPIVHAARYRHRDRAFDLRRSPAADGAFEAEVDGLMMRGRTLSTGAEHVVVEIDGAARTYRVRRHGDTSAVSSGRGQVDLVTIPRFPEATSGALVAGPTAPVPGRVVAVEVAVGDVVAPGDLLVVLEAMKVEHQVRAGVSATVTEVLVAAGATVDAHQLLIRLEETP